MYGGCHRGSLYISPILTKRLCRYVFVIFFFPFKRFEYLEFVKTSKICKLDDLTSKSVGEEMEGG